MEGRERPVTHFQDLIGDSPPMGELKRWILKAAQNNFTVLIQGESGTGKDLAARAIHHYSSRGVGPFVAINCAAVPENLLESELFGHEKGAFTGAETDKQGEFERAAGGTLFLDEVAELKPSMQAKLLRALQEREIKRLGGTRTIRVDIRIIAATNGDLEEAVASSEFRTDLYYRLNVFPVRTPALRKHPEDIPALARHFLSVYGPQAHPVVRDISPEVVAILQNYDWPGNVRQLQNVMAHAVAMASTGVVLPEDLPPSVFERAREKPEVGTGPWLQPMKESKSKFIENALGRAPRHYREVAKLLGMHPKSVHRALRRLKLTHLLK